MNLSIISTSFEMATSIKGLYNATSIMLYNRLMPIESYSAYENLFAPLAFATFSVIDSLLVC